MTQPDASDMARDASVPETDDQARRLAERRVWRVWRVHKCAEMALELAMLRGRRWESSAGAARSLMTFIHGMPQMEEAVFAIWDVAREDPPPGLDRVYSTSGDADTDARELYLTAVVARVLGAPWDDARRLARTGTFDEQQVKAIASEVSNSYDAGARCCSIHLVGRARQDHPGVADVALHQALSREPSRELLRHIGFALAGLDPTIHKGA